MVQGPGSGLVDGYFAQSSLAWLRERHGGGEENVVGWSIHCDESSPHLVAYVVPRDGDTLNAKKWLGGRAALSRMQSDFAEKVARHHELERGIEGSRAPPVHQGLLRPDREAGPARHHQPETVQPKVLKKGFLTSEYETPEMVAERLTASVQKAYTPAVEAAKLAASESRRADEMTPDGPNPQPGEKRGSGALAGPAKAPCAGLGAGDAGQAGVRPARHAHSGAGQGHQSGAGEGRRAGKARPGTTAPGG